MEYVAVLLHLAVVLVDSAGLLERWCFLPAAPTAAAEGHYRQVHWPNLSQTPCCGLDNIPFTTLAQVNQLLHKPDQQALALKLCQDKTYNHYNHVTTLAPTLGATICHNINFYHPNPDCTHGLSYQKKS